MSILSRRLALWGGAAALAAGGFAFMASNTFTSHPAAGAGTTTVSGFVISVPTFTGCGPATTGTNPENICYAHFYATPTASTASTVGSAYVQFGLATGGHTTWYGCNVTTTYNGAKNRYVTCDLRSHTLYPGTVKTETVSAIDFTATAP